MDHDLSAISNSDSRDNESNDNRDFSGARGRGNLLKNFREDSEAFCAVKALLVSLFVVTTVTVSVAAYAATANHQQDDFEAKVNLVLLVDTIGVNINFSHLCLMIVLPACHKSRWFVRSIYSENVWPTGTCWSRNNIEHFEHQQFVAARLFTPFRTICNDADEHVIRQLGRFFSNYYQ